MKLEVGMYVKTKKGIYKINYFINNNYTQKFTYIDNKGVSNILENDEVIKASHNIIDLIEEGDYVNGEKVLLKNEGYIKVGTGRDYIVVNNEKFIKSIVTKEQFESIKYSLEG